MSLDRTLAGRRVRLVSCSDPYTALRPGAEGTVQFVNDYAIPEPERSLHVKWDDGSNLGLIEGVDRWELLDE